MTHREAIDVLLNEWKCIDRNDGINCDRKCESCDLVMDVETIREAYNMAISALQAQNVPDTNVGDMISRQAAIDAFDGEKKDEDWCGEYDIGYNDGINLAISKLSVLPSAEPERKKGKWIDEKINSYTSRTYCSECGNSAPFICVSGDYYGRNMHGETNNTKFCPHCGADMRKEAEDED